MLRAGFTLLFAVSLFLPGCWVFPIGDPNDTGDVNTNGTVGEFADCTIPANEAELAAEVIRLVNAERSARGLNALVASPALSQAGGVHACDMIHYDFVGHQNPVTGSTPETRYQAAGFPSIDEGENVASGIYSASAVVDAWMASPVHQEVILTGYFTHVGVGIRVGGRYGVYWVLSIAGV
jgi:uncharacterized protein YkwD